MKILIILASAMFAMKSFAASDSVYTSILQKDCKVLESSELETNPEIDHLLAHCPGKAGYTVVISGGDIRYSLSLIFEGEELQFTHIGSFHDLGSAKIEWRGPVGKNGKVTSFHSLIYRLSIQQYNEKTAEFKDAEELFVVRLSGKESCLIGRVPLTKDMNEQARAIADDMTRGCLTEEQAQ